MYFIHCTGSTLLSKNLTDKDITLLVSNQSDAYRILRNIESIKYLLPMEVCTDSYDKILDQLFNAIINEGFTEYSFAHENNPSLTAANFLKKDDHYYIILRKHWRTLSHEIRRIFNV